MSEVRGKLEREHFGALVRGEETEVQAFSPDGEPVTVKLILADIGWDMMQREILHAQLAIPKELLGGTKF